MTTEPEPTLDDVPLESMAQAEAEAAAARSPGPVFDQRTQLACGSGSAVAVIGLIGSLVGAWTFDFAGVILIVAGLVAFGTAYVSFGREAVSTSVATRDLILGGGTISAALGILFAAEILADLDNMDAYGGIFGLVLTFGLAFAGVVLYFAATEWWTGGPATPWTAALASGDRVTRLVLFGGGLVLIGWLGNVTIGVWFLRAGVEVITLILLAALVMRAADDPEEPLRLPLPPAFLALALSILGAIIAVQHMSVFIGQTTGIGDWICQLVYVAGVVVVVVGAGIGSAEGSRSLTEGPTATPPA
jgi:hypothetical protein